MSVWSRDIALKVGQYVGAQNFSGNPFENYGVITSRSKSGYYVRWEEYAHSIGPYAEATFLLACMNCRLPLELHIGSAHKCPFGPTVWSLL